MAQEKLSMKKSDVEKAISNYVKKNYQELDVIGRYKPDSIQNVLARIQDREYFGAGNYNVLFDIYGTEIDGDNGQRENIHYTALCSVSVSANTEGFPLPKLNESLVLTKQSF